MKLSLPAFLLAASAAAKERDVFHARNTANRGRLSTTSASIGRPPPRPYCSLVGFPLRVFSFATRCRIDGRIAARKDERSFFTSSSPNASAPCFPFLACTTKTAIRRRVQHAAEMGSLEDIDVTVSRLNSPETPRRELGIFGEVKAFGPDGICADGDEYGTLNLTQPYEPLRKPTQFYPDTDGVTRVTLKYEPIQYHGPSYSNIIRAWNNEVP